MSAMKFKMNKSDKALRSELHSCKSRRVPEGKKHDRHSQMVRSSLLYTSESWCWKKELHTAGKAVAWIRVEHGDALGVESRWTSNERTRSVL